MKYGMTPLMDESVNGNVVQIRWLLNQPGIEMNLQNDFGYTALMLAIWWNQFNVVWLLLEQESVHLNLGTVSRGETALMTAAARKQGEVVKQLLRRGADVKVVDKERRTAWDYAKSQEIKDMIQTSQKKPKSAMKCSLQHA